ncbi:hypothetical protein ACK8P5_06815 [Paenibacillus sp. EC2-1]|uniref:hypothetical protein n=1 Tax=Paenibacillus sp. EC2-1 TaxID=3388665 RepID=UPI003BEF3BA4
MSKQIQAYFRTESEAEGARTTLQTYKVDQLEVGQLQDAIGKSANIIVPLVPWNVSGVGGTAPGSGPVGGAPVSPGAIVGTNALPGTERSEDLPAPEHDNWVDNTELTDSDYDDLKYVLSAKVNDADYDEVVQVLRKNQAFIERFE